MPAGEPLRLVGILRELDAAGLAAPARQHLRLDHHGAAELLGGRTGLGRGQGDAAGRDGDAVAGEQLLALVLIEIHGSRIAAASMRRHRRTPARQLSGRCTLVESTRVFGSGLASAFSEFFELLVVGDR